VAVSHRVRDLTRYCIASVRAASEGHAVDTHLVENCFRLAGAISERRAARAAPPAD